MILCHTTRAPPVGFELATNGLLFYVNANLEKASKPEVLRKRHPRPPSQHCVAALQAVGFGDQRPLPAHHEVLSLNFEF